MKNSITGKVTGKAMVITLAFIMLCSTTMTGIGGLQQVYAKDIGSKNPQACDNCEKVVNPDESPVGYQDLLGDGSVYRGGNSFSKWQSGWYDNQVEGVPTRDNTLDNDPNDFATPLPYGNTYIDTSKLVWTNPGGFIIDIQDDRFQWVSQTPLKDAKEHESTDDPMAQGKGFSGTDGIYYVGELHSYLSKVTDPARLVSEGEVDSNGNKIGPNMIVPEAGKDYLYRITYLNAVTLPDGTKGNLQLTMERMQLESSFTTNAANPYVITSSGDSYDKAIIRVQGTNELALTTNMKDGAGNDLNPREFVALTASEVAGIRDTVNTYLPNNQQLGDSTWDTDKTTRHAVGGLLDLDIMVTDQDLKPVSGTISYAAHDLDLTTAEGLWGRPITRKPDNTYDTKFGEGMKIVSGSLSYALTPKYEHDNNRNGGVPTSQQDGWLERGPFEKADKDSPLAITRDEAVPGVPRGPADGVRFSTSAITNMRDKNGIFKDVFFNDGATIRTLHNHQAQNQQLQYADLNQGFGNNFKKLVYGMMRRDGFEDTPPAWNHASMTAELAFKYLGDASWKTDRGDDPSSFDTGFAVLLDAAGSKLQWSASRIAGGAISTTLFDSTMYTYVETTHGTGGGIYMESYDMQHDCAPVMNEGVMTMGRHSENTVTAVPEDGYRINRILVGDTNFGKGSAASGLADYTEYVIDGNDIKVSGQVVGTFSGANVTGNPGMKTGVVLVDGFNYDTSGARQSTAADKKIRIERNADGTVDVTLPDIDNPMHVHVDFGADYHFYKVWVQGEPTQLNMTVAPAGFYPTEVELPVPTGEIDVDGKAITELVKFTIDYHTYTAQNGEYKGASIEGYEFKLTANNTIEYVETDPNTGEETLAIRPNVVLVGNSFVHYAVDPVTGNRDIDAEYKITMEDRIADWDGEDAKEFAVDDTSDYAQYVEVLGDSNTISPGNKVWLIKYPSEGVESLNWPALPVEDEPDEDNHNASNHHHRNFWFAVEEAPAWCMESYDNKNAELPGVVTATYYHDSNWYQSTIKDEEEAQKLVHEDNERSSAYLSVFKNGGEIVNVPSVIVRGVKEWKDDYENAFKTRQDIWLHIDAEIDGKKIEDILPPQKIASGATGNALIKSWGTKTGYATEDANVSVVASAKNIPSAAHRQDDGSYIMSGKVYWLDELKGVNADGKPYQYSIRETLDKEGTRPVEKNNPDAGLIGYASKDSADWTELSAERTADTEGLSGKDAYTVPDITPEVKINRYTGTLENTLELTDFTVTKIWEENGATGDGRTHDASTLSADVAKLKGAYTLKESDAVIADTSQLKLQPDTAVGYTPASGDTPASGTLETKVGNPVDGNPTTVFTWHNIPKYVGDGAGSVHEAVYSVTETQLNGYDAPIYSDGDKALNEGDITNTVRPPEGEPKQTWGEKNTPQTVNANDMFDVTTETTTDGSPNMMEKFELIDPATGEPAESVTVEGGRYTIADDGTITFTPDTDFVGNPPPVTVRGTDSNGLSAETTYTPHVCDTETKVKRTIVYEYENGNPVKDSNGDPITVVQEVTFKGVIDPDTGEISYPGNPTETFDEVPSDAIDGYTVDRDTVAEVTVRPRDKDLFEKVIYSPKGVEAKADTTWGLPDEPQTGTPTFNMETPTYTDGTPNKLTIKLIDPATGEETDEKTVDAVDGEGNKVGTYTLNDDGTVTFMPDPGYVGNPMPLELTGTDRFGSKAKTTYTPHIVDPVIEDSATRTIHYTYLTEDGEEVTGDVKQTIVLKKHATKVDPKTGEVLEWGTWEPASFPAVKNPDDKVDGRVWFTDDVAGELEVTEPGDKGVTHIVYEKIPYTVTYLDGDHGKSDHKGDQKGQDYGNDVTGGNGITPDKGYKFTGTYTYVITDHDGNVVGRGTTNDPTSIPITGNIEFTPVYEKQPAYNINYDPNGGTGTMKDDNYLADDETMPDKDNEFTRRGYHFLGFYGYITDPRTGEEKILTDKNGKPILFTKAEDMHEYFKDMPDGTSIRMEAQWEPDSYTIKYDANGGKGTMDPQYISGDAGVANSKINEFTREGYTFKGFKAILPDGTYLKDSSGNELIFSSTEDFFDYLAEYGDGAEITLVAQWEPIPTPAQDPATGTRKPATGDGNSISLWIMLMASSILCMAAIAMRKRVRGR